MKVEFHFINWNDSFYIPFIAEHYGKFCSKIKMFDNHSTDDSVKLAKYYGFEVESFGTNQLNDQHYLDIKQHSYKKSDADYVIIGDADEFVYPVSLTGNFPKVQGYNLMSNEPMKESIDELKFGYPDELYSKRCIVKPSEITELTYQHGCHNAWAKAKKLDESGFAYLKHARCIFGVEALIERHLQYKSRMSHFNLKFKMGFHYLHEADAKRKEWEINWNKSKVLW